MTIVYYLGLKSAVRKIKLKERGHVLAKNRPQNVTCFVHSIFILMISIFIDRINNFMINAIWTLFILLTEIMTNKYHVGPIVQNEDHVL